MKELKAAKNSGKCKVDLEDWRSRGIEDAKMHRGIEEWLFNNSSLNEISQKPITNTKSLRLNFVQTPPFNKGGSVHNDSLSENSQEQLSDNDLFASLEFAPRSQSFADVPLAQSAQSVRYPDFVRPQIRYSPICLFTEKALSPNRHIALSPSIRKVAFTLAETLITLAIIGVVAAITIPNVVTKYQKKSTAIQLKKAFADLENAIKLSEIENGDMNNWSYPISTDNTSTKKAFINQYLQPYFRNSTIKSYYGNPSLITSDGKRISFEFLGVANWIIIDLNGLNGPNEAGKDIFVLDILRNKDYNPESKLIFWAATCSNNINCLTGNDWSFGCNKKLNNWEIPDYYPW